MTLTALYWSAYATGFLAGGCVAVLAALILPRWRVTRRLFHALAGETDD